MRYKNNVYIYICIYSVNINHPTRFSWKQEGELPPLGRSPEVEVLQFVEAGYGWEMNHVSDPKSVPSGKRTKSYWKLLFIVDLPIKNGDFPQFLLVYQRVNDGNIMGTEYQPCFIPTLIPWQSHEIQVFSWCNPPFSQQDPGGSA